jgi:hypothetical protein
MLRIADATPVNSTEISHATAHKDDDAPLHDLDVVAVFGKAFVSAGLTNEGAAKLMKLDKAHWSRQLNGADNQHISFQRMLRGLPRAFWLSLLQELAAPLDVVVAHPDIADRALHQLFVSVEAVCAYARQDRALRQRQRVG